MITRNSFINKYYRTLIKILVTYGYLSCSLQPTLEYSGDTLLPPRGPLQVPAEISSTDVKIDTNKNLTINGRLFYVHNTGQLILKEFDKYRISPEKITDKRSKLFEENKKNSNCKIVLINSKPPTQGKQKGKKIYRELPSPTFYVLVKDGNGKIKGGSIKKKKIVDELFSNPLLYRVFQNFMENSELKSFVRPKIIKPAKDIIAKMKQIPSDQVLKSPTLEDFYKNAPSLVDAKTWKQLSSPGVIDYNIIPITNGAYVINREPSGFRGYLISPKNPKLVPIE